ncbi:hypothetical protein DPMN_075581 [Dreissena polymorpha]|uniref:Uncharacterized protein n=1 Tax=Dreissena polymorpha TaxID=45954 RepID=A0A9D3YLZ3_DREPO|nr:hypothetical protein DPMN_075581 [Dreissena polymorpha]
MHETRRTKTMTVVSRPDQLVNCSMKGDSTKIREGLPIAERCAIVDGNFQGKTKERIVPIQYQTDFLQHLSPWKKHL